jgi:hypothetical protein
MCGGLVLLLDYSHGGKVGVDGRPSYPKDKNSYKVRWCWEFLYDYYPWFLHPRISRPPYLDEKPEDPTGAVRPWNQRWDPLTGDAVCSHNGEPWTPREHPDLNECAAELRKHFGRLSRKARAGDREAAARVRILRPYFTGYQQDVILAEMTGQPVPQETTAYTLPDGIELEGEDDDVVEVGGGRTVVDLRAEEGEPEGAEEEGEGEEGEEEEDDDDAIEEVAPGVGGPGPA